MQSNYKEIAMHLLNEIKTRDKDKIIATLIKLGRENIFIPVLIDLIKLANTNQENIMHDLSGYLDAAYSPGLRAHILDDFIRESIRLQGELNELKTKHLIYVMEQKLFMYRQAEKMLRSSSTTGTTQVLLKVLQFRGD
jgi:hypothetical protein